MEEEEEEEAEDARGMGRATAGPGVPSGRMIRPLVESGLVWVCSGEESVSSRSLNEDFSGAFG